jgi:Ni,Fe-hydrogenase III component G
MTDQDKIAKAKAVLGDKLLEATNPAPRRVFLAVSRDNLVAATALLKEHLGCWYLATVSGVDKGDAFEVLYHFGVEDGNINLRTRVPKDDLHLPSTCGVLPGAVLYERELQDMFGLVVDGLPDPRPLVMPDGWPAGNFPLRKDWTFDRPEEKIPGGKR